MKPKRIWVGLVGLVLLLSQVLSPSVAMAADTAHYEMENWIFRVVGDSDSINFYYIGKDGIPLSAGFELDKDLVAGHENDQSWTGLDSAAPILSYIKKYGKNNVIQEAMNPTCFDPSIFKALAGQEINLNQLGGSNVPPGSTPPANLVGKSILPNILIQHVVGIGIPAPNLSAIASTQQSPPAATSTTVAQTSSQKTATATNPTPPPAPTPPTTSKLTSSSSEAKIGTVLNPTPAVKGSVAASKANPDRVNPPPMAINSTTPTKIQTPASASQTNSARTNWKLYLELGGLLLILVAGFIYIKKNYAHS